MIFKCTLIFQSYYSIYYKSNFRTDGSQVNKSIAKVLKGSSLYLEMQKTTPIEEDNIWRGPVVIVRHCICPGCICNGFSFLWVIFSQHNLN